MTRPTAAGRLEALAVLALEGRQNHALVYGGARKWLAGVRSELCALERLADDRDLERVELHVGRAELLVCAVLAAIDRGARGNRSPGRSFATHGPGMAASLEALAELLRATETFRRADDSRSLRGATADAIELLRELAKAVARAPRAAALERAGAFVAALERALDAATAGRWKTEAELDEELAETGDRDVLERLARGLERGRKGREPRCVTRRDPS